MKPLGRRIQRLAIAAGTIALALAGLAVALVGSPFNLPDLFAHGSGAATQVLGKSAGLLYIVLGSAPVLIVFWCAVAGWGSLVQRKLAPTTARPVITQLVTGLGAMLFLSWITGILGLANAWTAWAIAAVGVLLLAWIIADQQLRKIKNIDLWPSPPWPLIPALPLAALVLVAACCPPSTLWSVEAFGYDVMSYHLQLPREWIAQGRIAPAYHNVLSFLPNLVEAGFMQLGLMSAGMLKGIYIVQLSSAIALVLLIFITASIARLRTGPVAATAGGITLAALPWVLISSTSAYDETFALCLGFGAIFLILENHRPNRRRTILIGALLGLTALAKLTIGAMLIPAALLLTLLPPIAPVDPPSQPGRAIPPAYPLSKRLATAAWLTLAVALTVSPYLVRNAIWSAGNPVFPLAAGTLGQGYWSDEQVARWNRATGSNRPAMEGVTHLADRWLLSPGYGALGPARVVQPDRRENGFDITRFHRHGYVPLFFLLAAGGAWLGWRDIPTRPLTRAMLILLGVSLGVWILFTHHQARFLLPTVVPGGVLIALGAQRMEESLRRARRWVWPTAVTVALFALEAGVFSIFIHQTRTVIVDGTLVNLPAYALADSLPAGRTIDDLAAAAVTLGDHPVNHLPAGSTTLVVADAAVLYISAPFRYNSAFDTDPLGLLIRRNNANGPLISTDLKQAGFTHVWVNWSELARLHSTYGYDPAVTPDTISHVAQRGNWKPILELGIATLYQLP